MTQQRKPADRRAAPSPATARSSRRTAWIIAGAVAGVALIAFIVASFSAGGNESDDGLQETASVTVTGAALPPLPETGADPAEGLTLADMVGESFDGTPVSIANDGRAKVILVLAHW
jgi:hypothetical protein